MKNVKNVSFPLFQKGQVPFKDGRKGRGGVIFTQTF